MKRLSIITIVCMLHILLFAYTATSKFLDYNLFVFQMKRAPLPLMQNAAPILGWLLPVIEMLIVIGLLISNFRLRALYCSVILLTMFEIYIIGMLATHQHLPCTCGGIISSMTWKQHLFFNAAFIFTGMAAIVQIKKNNLYPSKFRQDNSKDLSRA